METYGKMWKHMGRCGKMWRKCGEIVDDARFIQAQEAFRWLSDPQQREVYAWSPTVMQNPCRDG